MPRALSILLLVWTATAAASQGFESVQPTLKMRGPSGPVVAGSAFEVSLEVELPPGYYQDADSPFLLFEPSSSLHVESRWASEPGTRHGRPSYEGHFVLTRSVTLAEAGLRGAQRVTWEASWQICKIDGVCLLPAKKAVTLEFEVAPLRSPSSPAGWEVLALTLMAAFLGGLLLNAMPCVFPVLVLKALSLAAGSHNTTTERRLDAFAFAAGSLGMLTGLGIVTGAASWWGQSWHWGFTFQQPTFVWLLLLLFWVFTLQLWGVWTWENSPFSLKTKALPNRFNSALGGAFLVVSAAPCTAPFLGPALGWAFTQSPWEIPLFFFFAGLGLVTPLVLISLVPSWSRRLPKAGPWTTHLQKGAGFFLSGTVIYLLWILTRQIRPEFVWPALAVLVLTAAGFGASSIITSGLGRRLLAGAGLVALAVVSSLILAPAPSSDSPSTAAVRFSRAVLETTLRAHRFVLVEGTAAWCATCQVNEITVLRRPDVLNLLKSLDIEVLVADDTTVSPEIEAWLTSVQRAGLPVYALYRPGSPAYLFPELLTDENFTRVLPRLVGSP